MELIVLAHLNQKDYVMYLFGDFNISLLQNGNCILNGKGTTDCLLGTSSYLDK